jgi:hypothetical protein
MTEAPPGFRPTPGIACPFLNGQLRAEGRFFEECRPGSSLLAKGRQAILKLSAQGHWSLVNILILDLGKVLSPSRTERLYEWTFLVIGKPHDRLHLFGEKIEDEVAIEDLLSLLGATADDLGRDAQGQAVTFTSEGGFRATP